MLNDKTRILLKFMNTPHDSSFQIMDRSPDIYVIYTVRDPRATALSRVKKKKSVSQQLKLKEQ